MTVLRHVEPADRVLSAHLRKSPPAFVRNVLRLAVVELAQEFNLPRYEAHLDLLPQTPWIEQD